MAKASPLIRAFNGGEFSQLMEGRTDLDRYPASMRTLYNFIAAPQGPALARSGTQFVEPRAKRTEYSAMIPFVPKDDEAWLIEVTDNHLRFINEDGLLVYPDVMNATYTNSGGFMRAVVTLAGDITSDHFNTGFQVVLSGFTDSLNLNSRVGNYTFVTAGGGTATIQTDIAWPGGASYSEQLQLVYSVAGTFTLAQREAMTYVQSVDVIYLLTGSRPKKLSRYDTYNWTLEDVEFVDGPFMPVNDTDNWLKPDETGNAIPSMSSNSEGHGTASGSTNRPVRDGTYDDPVNYLQRQISYHLDASEYYHAFSGNADKYWAPNETQEGTIQYDPTSSFVCSGYSIVIPQENLDPTYTSKDHAPSTWRFEGKSDGDWTLLDRRDDYVLWDGHRSVFFEIHDPEPYSQYRLVISKCLRNGLIEPRVKRLVIRSPASATFKLKADTRENINNGEGFLSTDVGRLMRIKGNDARWRTVKITHIIDEKEVRVNLLGDPLPGLDRINEWQMGYWSDTTGWPTVGDFIDDRLWLCSSREAPDMFAASVVGDYENFQSSDEDGVVLDDSAMVLRLNSRKQASICWISADDKGILMGTSSEEYVMSAASTQTGMSAKNFRVRRVSGRGSRDVQPVRVDKQVLFVTKSGRNLREFTYTFESDGYQSPSMMQLASHVSEFQIEELAFAQEPHSIVWARRSDGSLVGMTYNREENVIGWHRHDVGGDIVNMTVLPSQNGEQDTLWLQVKRTINGVDQYYIEYLTPFWNFGSDIDESHYVDCGLRYIGSPITTLYGLWHLEGRTVFGLRDNTLFGPVTVVNGAVTGVAASNILVGLGYECLAETSRLENGAADGTAIGKVKRINNVVFYLWESLLGQYGTYNREKDLIDWQPMQYDRPDTYVDGLYTGPTQPLMLDPDYNERGSIAFRKPMSAMFPFNVVAIAPQLNTQDR
jgi:hypothetical protein